MGTTSRRLIDELMNLLNAEDIYGAIRPMYGICRICGLFPVGRDKRVSIPYLMCTVSFLCCQSVYYAYCRTSEPCLDNSCLRNHVMTVVISSSFVFLLLIIVSLIKAADDIERTMRKMKSVDKDFRQLGTNVQFSRKYVIKAIAMSLVWFGHVWYVSVSFSNRKDLSTIPLILYRFTQTSSFILFFYVSQPLVVFAQVFRQYFFYLLEHLNQIPHLRSFSKRVHVLERTIILYNELCEMCDVIDESFGFQLFVMVLAVFLDVTASLFLLTGHALRFTYQSIPISKVGIIILTLWTSYWFFLLLDIIKQCNNCSSKVNSSHFITVS